MDVLPDQDIDRPLLSRRLVTRPLLTALSRHGLEWVGLLQAGPGYEAAHHGLQRERLLVSLTGAGETWLSGRMAPMPAGTLAWQHPGEPVWQRSCGEWTFCLLNGRSDGPLGRGVHLRPPGTCRADASGIGGILHEILREPHDVREKPMGLIPNGTYWCL